MESYLLILVLQVVQIRTDNATVKSTLTSALTTEATCTGQNCTSVTNVTTTATTLAPVETTVAPVMKKVQKASREEVCLCNLRHNFCDINCCCDDDCSFEDKFIFSSCRKDEHEFIDTRFCSYLDYIYINNTRYEWEVNQNGMFCILKSNLPKRYTITKKTQIKSIEDAEFQKQFKFEWSSLKIGGTNEMLESYKFGSNIWILKNSNLDIFKLPHGFVNGVCLMKKGVNFLQDLQTQCIQTEFTENNLTLNAETYFKNFSIIAIPDLFKSNKNCSNKTCIAIETKICWEGFKNCSTFSKDDKRLKASCKLIFSSNENSCVHLTRRIKYDFFHNGSKGITKVNLFLVLTNITYYANENFRFPQSIEVNFYWTNFTRNFTSLLSGNPGYLIGKPILLGNLMNVTFMKNSTNLTEFRQEIVRNPHEIADNFLLLPKSLKGICVLNDEDHVLVDFGVNMISKCKIRRSVQNLNFTANQLCQNIQMAIFQYFSFNATNIDNASKVIGAFGNSNASIFNDWSKIMFRKDLKQMLNETTGNFTNGNHTVLCSNVTTFLKIDFFHARVTFKTVHDQEKILGTLATFGSFQNFEFRLKESIDLNVDLRVEVMFFDVTKEKVQKFVDPPSLEIKLPYDFFYPFVKIDSSANTLRLSLFLTILVSAVDFFVI